MGETYSIARVLPGSERQKSVWSTTPLGSFQRRWLAAGGSTCGDSELGESCENW